VPAELIERPKAAKAGAMPTHEGLRPYDRHRRSKPAIQLDEGQAIAICNADATAHAALLVEPRTPDCSSD
jgi:hypothetical protein